MIDKRANWTHFYAMIANVTLTRRNPMTSGYPVGVGLLAR